MKLYYGAFSSGLEHYLSMVEIESERDGQLRPSGEN